MRRLITSLMAFGLVLGACSTDPTASEEYQELETKLATVEQQLSDMTAERDSLAGADVPAETRHERARAHIDLVMEILDDPDAFGSEEEVVSALVEHYTPDAVMDDIVFGAVPIANAWHNVLYGGMVDADIDVYHSWLSDDGSQGGYLWLWHGTNAAGNPFELPGISLCEFDEDGLESYEYVVYPYPDDHVRTAFEGSGS
ncbi:MAG: hypothetical protein PVF87_02950 [Acidimicrobiia bacterium]|jgi:hypothetical protein